MRADSVEVSWDEGKGSWLARIINGEEVIRRNLKLSRSADEPSLRQAVQQTLVDEGYEADGSPVTIATPA
jgi:hypothetical protein